MKKIALLFSALIMTVASSMTMASVFSKAADEDFFIGVSGEWSQNKVKGQFGTVDSYLRDDEVKVKGNGWGIRLGSFWQDEMRAYLTIGQSKLKDTKLTRAATESLSDMKTTNILFSGDYIFMPKRMFNPFAGLTLGAADHKVKDHKAKWGIMYGLQGGVMYKIEQVDLEAGVRWLFDSTKQSHNVYDNIHVKTGNSRQIFIAASLHF